MANSEKTKRLKLATLENLSQLTLNPSSMITSAGRASLLISLTRLSWIASSAMSERAVVNLSLEQGNKLALTRKAGPFLEIMCGNPTLKLMSSV